MKDKFAIAVENSTASFIKPNNFICDSALSAVNSVIGGEGEKVILCFDSGWFAVGKQIKDSLASACKVVSFCVEDQPDFEKTCTQLLNSVNCISDIIVIGSEELALFAISYCKNEKRVIYIPLDFNFASFVTTVLKNNGNHLLITDLELLSKCGKNKLTDGARCVLSKKILLVEMRANQLIGGFLPKNNAQEKILKAQEYLKDYLKTHGVGSLVTALLFASAGEVESGAGNVPLSAGNILYRIRNLSLKGERDYLLYKMVLRAYNLYFSNDTDFTLALPGVVMEQEEIKNLFPNTYQNLLADLPEYIYNFEKINELKGKIINDGSLLTVIKKQLEEIESDEQILKKEYGGRKYSVEHYNAKERSKALRLAPYITKEPTAYSLLFASGFTEYFK